MNAASKKIDALAYCVPCDYSDHALMATQELVKNFQHDIKTLTLITGSKGIFEIKVNDAVIFSKSDLGKFPEPGELVNRLTEKIFDR
jgi:selenoprotein W-related protein